MANQHIYALINYEDDYVQPLILSALKKKLPSGLLLYITDLSEAPSPSSRILQWRQYESIDFDHVLSSPLSSLSNSYIIRKALIRKNYLSRTVTHHLAKHADSVLKNHFKAGVEIELDYAEFLDDALDEAEAWELRESWAGNAEEDGMKGKEWWILKPSMGERGQGIRLFSSQEELEEIFKGWDPDSDEDDDEENNTDDHEDAQNGANGSSTGNDSAEKTNGFITSHLRHFTLQPYIHPPLLLDPPHNNAGRKFHIRTYVLAVGALKVYIYKPMLALFAAAPYVSPDASANVNEHLESHLTNTCLQSSTNRDGSVCAFWDLPLSIQSLSHRTENDWRQDIWDQICSTTSEIFAAAAKGMSTHFQILPNAFEILALDFLVDASGTAWLLEVNAFPDFKQTGDELKGLIEGLFEGVVNVAVKPFFCGDNKSTSSPEKHMIKVLDIDLGRR